MFWAIIAIVYAILAISTGRWFLKLRSFENKSESTLVLAPGSIKVTDNKNDIQQGDLVVREMFKSIVATDIVALLIGLLAAIWSFVAS
ncbi:hypothetical protein [Haloarcula sp. Atlit-120R]|uniref:hypothetical protein n=1 Tax=Haloarcula sp. Atlit-120R TaxID=2282135 RepID=UPI0011C35284|nr:hypothetical protein [Haloarcula sp. Atlit-120R]